MKCIAVAAFSLALLHPASAAENGTDTSVPTFGPTTTSTYYPTYDYDETPTEPGVDTQYDAVIVGAGWAGLRAAMTLLDANVSFLVLEANDYVGGRSKTVNADGSINVPNPSNLSHAPIDLGSEWLYVEDNDMEDYLRNNDLLTGIDLDDGEAHFLAIEEALFYMQSRDESGFISTELLDETETTLLRGRVWDRFLAFRNDLLGNGRDMSYRSAVNRFIKDKNLNEPKDIQYLNLLLDLGEIDYIGDSSELSLDQYEWQDGDALDPKHYMSVPGAGYGNTAASFAVPLSSKVKLGAKVTEINHETPNKAVITFTKDGVVEQITSKTVLVTASLGVLKAGTIQFTPDLPRSKQDAIDNTGFGVMNKCAMQWNDADAVVWPDEEWLELITPDDATSGQWTTFYNPSARKGIPTLVAWIGGHEALQMENLSDEEVLDNVMKNLQAMFPTITYPDRVVVSRWGQEENILGTYSFCNVGQNFEYDSDLMKRRVGNVWFAGEHTAGEWYGTTVGAWDTGEEAAQGMIPEITRLNLELSRISSEPSSQPSSRPSLHPSAEPSKSTFIPAPLESVATMAPRSTLFVTLCTILSCLLL